MNREGTEGVAARKEGPFLPGLKMQGILGRFGEKPTRRCQAVTTQR